MTSNSKELKDVIKELNNFFTEDHIHQFIDQYYRYIVSPDNNITGQSLGESIFKGGNNLKSEIEKLPIYFIIAHSAYDINISDTIEPVLPDDSNSNFFKMPISTNLSNNKFLIYNSPAGTLGLVSTAKQCINPKELLSATDIFIKETLFNPKIKFQNKLGNYKRKANKTCKFISNGICQPEDELSSSFYLPGSIVIDKNHYFYGNKLLGTGLGIIRINDYGHLSHSLSRKNNTGYKLLKNSTNIPSCFYLSNTKLTKNDRLLKDYISIETNKYQGIKISKIIEMGDPGIYISLGCGGLNLNLQDSSDNLYKIIINKQINDKSNNVLKLYIDLIKTINNLIIPNKGIQWDTFCKTISEVKNTRNKSRNSTPILFTSIMTKSQSSKFKDYYANNIKGFFTETKSTKSTKSKKRKRGSYKLPSEPIRTRKRLKVKVNLKEQNILNIVKKVESKKKTNKSIGFLQSVSKKITKYFT